MAELQQAVITGSLIIHDKGRYYNRLLWVRPDQTVEQYDKKHLFRMAGETHVYSPGTQHLMVELKGWRIYPLVCYDLRFPVWSRNVADGGYDLLLYVANWPEVRSNAWKTLLQARAIENLAYTVGVNRVGADGKGINHSGDSMVVDPKGNILVQLAHHESHHTLSLSRQELENFRKKFPALLDADPFTLRVLPE
ncbi:MAG: nitrilase family protein, partial [Hymenobacteraceae bacterium]|nr:nitrilase family protein [Hymenobacteraceae bacterium]MDX5394660.1 nitrilase family protein [Hymenobacteraceae bacterium]MDX5510691.1 nitrilase family protein [Hymenobacteraceae bacterium]